MRCDAVEQPLAGGDVVCHHPARARTSVALNCSKARCDSAQVLEAAKPAAMLLMVVHDMATVFTPAHTNFSTHAPRQLGC